MSAALLRRIAELEEFILQQKEAFAPKVGFPLGWKLDPRESTILSALHATTGSYVTFEALLLCIAGFDEDQDEYSVRAWLARLRRKLQPFGIEIVNRPHQGYALEAKGRAIVAAALGQAVPERQAIQAAPIPAHPRGWTDPEDAIVRRGYERGTTLSVIRRELLLAGHRARSIGSISMRASTLGLGSVRAVAAWTAPEDAILSAAYADEAPITAIRLQLAAAGFRRNRGAIQMRAIAIGVSGGRVKTWTDSEKAIVRAGLDAGDEYEIIRDRLRAHGFERGRTAVYKLARSMGRSRADRPWCAEDDARLGDLYHRKTPVRAIATAMGRTVGAIASRASDLGLKQRIPWDDAQRARLRRGAEAGTALDVVARDIGRSVSQAKNEARRLGLRFPPMQPRPAPRLSPPAGDLPMNTQVAP